MRRLTRCIPVSTDGFIATGDDELGEQAKPAVQQDVRPGRSLQACQLADGIVRDDRRSAARVAQSP